MAPFGLVDQRSIHFHPGPRDNIMTHQTHSEEYIHHCRILRDLCSRSAGSPLREGAPVPVYLHRPSGNQFCLLRLQGDWVLASVNARGVQRADLSGWEVSDLPALYGAPGTVKGRVQWAVIVDWRWSTHLHQRHHPDGHSCLLDDRDISGEYEAYLVLSQLLNLRFSVQTRSDLLK